MTTPGIYLSTTIPYINGRPHLGHALEFVQADVLARHYRRAGRPGPAAERDRRQLAEERARRGGRGHRRGRPGEPEQRRVRGAGGPLQLSFDDFIRTSSDPRHRPGVERFWRACAARGDLYRKSYQGLYCTGCEQFYRPAELDGGRCPEHGTEPETVSEENWFFRLSRYAGQLQEAITSGRLRIEPAARRNEVLAFIDGGLEDFSASRRPRRAGGWGIPVPGDPGQVIYVWWDALGNYITAWATVTDRRRRRGGAGGPGPAERIHLAGKGVLRFHAVYWPAMLLSAGLPLPTAIFVHDYLTIGGAKISKSQRRPRRPTRPRSPAAYGADAVRWWLLREVPRTGDADFTAERLVARANEDLANGLGNLVSRVTSMVHRYRDGVVPAAGDLAAGRDHGARPRGAGRGLRHAAGPDRRGAGPPGLPRRDGRPGRADRPGQPVHRGHRAVAAGPGGRRRRLAAAAQLDAVLAALTGACRTLAAELAPFLPGLSAKVAAACDGSSGRLPPPRSPRIPGSTHRPASSGTNVDVAPIAVRDSGRRGAGAGAGESGGAVLVWVPTEQVAEAVAGLAGVHTEIVNLDQAAADGDTSLPASAAKVQRPACCRSSRRSQPWPP